MPITTIPDHLLPTDPTPEEVAGTESDTQISGKGADPTHHIKLVDGEGSSVGFVITDQEGYLDERTFRRFPSSDPQNPYVTERQESFGAGFGQSIFEQNRSKYWRSEGVSTIKDALVAGPMFHYGRGLNSHAEEYMPDTGQDMGWQNLIGSYAWLAMPFTPSQAWTETTYLKIWIKNKDAPATLRIRTYTDTTGAPGTLINTKDYTTSDFDGAYNEGKFVRIAIPDTYAFGSGTQYWVVITTTGTASGYWSVWGTTNGSGGLQSTNGTAWSAGPEFYFRIEGTRTSATHHFYEYKKQLYFVTNYDDFAASQVWMNGWRGVADSNSGQPSRLNDATQNWSGLMTGDEVVQIYAGRASGEQEDFRFVSAGSNGYLTVSRNWDASIVHTNWDEYVVNNTDLWFQIDDGSNLAGRVTDIANGKGLAHFCRGNNRSIMSYEAYRNSSGVWTERWVPSFTNAEFAREVVDPVLGDVIWFAHNRVVDGSYKPYVWYSVPIDGWAHNAFDIGHMGPNSGRTNQQWVNAGGSQVAVTEQTGGSVKIDVTIGEITGVSVNAQGTGYAQNEKLYIAGDPGISAQLNIDTVGGGGEVLSVSIDNGNQDFDTGTGFATTTNGSGTACTIDIDTVSTFTGDIAYLDFYDEDGNAATYDFRNMTRIACNAAFDTEYNQPNELAAGDLILKISDSTALGNVISSSSWVGLSAGFPDIPNKNYATMALTGTKGAGSVASIGISLNAAHSLDRSFYFVFSGYWYVQRFQSPVEVGFRDGDNITGLQAYGDPETAWVMTESGFGQIKNNRFMPVPMREIKVAAHHNNGKGSEVSDVYLLFTWKGRLQRYYRQNMEDLGPEFPAGMADIAGDIVDVVTYPGRFYVAVDGGTTARSMILCHKGSGWHEVYTSFTGERIRKLFIQPIEGKPDKLWASVGGDVMWFPIILDDTELPDNSGYEYRPMGYLDTSWIYTSERDLNKVFRSVVATLDKAIDTDLKLRMYYKVDNDDDDWKIITNVATHSYSTIEYNLIEQDSPEPRGNRVKFRLYMETKDINKSHAVRSILSRLYRLPEIKYIYTWLSKISSISVNLRGDDERSLGTQPSAQMAMAKLDGWAANLTVLTTECDIAAADGKSVILEPIPFQLLLMVHDERMQEESIQISANEV